jgi:hypothetical protein
MGNTELSVSSRQPGVLPNGQFDSAAIGRLDTTRKTVQQVSTELWRLLIKTEFEPEWLSPANLSDLGCEAAWGARHDRLWPSVLDTYRLSLSVGVGKTGGWVIQVDRVTRYTETVSGDRRYGVLPLLRAKTFSRTQAWELARVIAHLLDIA